MNTEVIDILFIGDIVGRIGRNIVKDFLQEQKFDFVIANVENASHGFGLTQKNYEDLKNSGINAMTSGNHIWDKKEIYDYINNAEILVRPLNYPNCEYGLGYRIFDVTGIRIAVANLLGRTFMNAVDSPFDTLREFSEKIKSEADFSIVDFHAEATAEKISLGYYAAELGIDVVLGTHTHVPTADEQILDDKTLYMTDVGFCGAKRSIIGMDVDIAKKRWLSCIAERLEVSTETCAIFNALKFSINKKTLKCEQFERISFTKDFSEV